MRGNKKKKHSFSIIELTCVMCVIMTLVAITVGIYSNYMDSSKNGQAKTLIIQLSTALQAYKLDQGFYLPGSATYPNPLPSSVTADNYFKFNYAIGVSNKADTALTQYFDYQRLKGYGLIKTVPGASGYQYVVDPWGNALLYRNPGSFNETMFDIGSLGKDGKYGAGSSDPADYGKGDDITNFNQ